MALPAADAEPGPVWLEAAVDGVVVFDRDGRIARHLGRVRGALASGAVERRSAHGQPYWTRAT